MAPRVAVAAILLVVALGLDTDSWSPKDSVKALDAVIKAVDKITNLPGLSAEQEKEASHAAADVKAAIEAAEGSANVTKAQAHQRVGAAIAELAGLARSLQATPPNMTALQAKKEKLEHELAAKQAELAKDEKMMKLIKLQKELAEKKLLLQALLKQKEAGKKDQELAQEQAAQEATSKKLLRAAKSLESVKQDASALPLPLQHVLTDLRARERNVSASLAGLDADEEKNAASLKAAFRKKGQISTKEQSMLKMIRTQEHRKYAKARALKTTMLRELKDAESSIEHRDMAKLRKVMSQMQREGKALQAQTGDFLH